MASEAPAEERLFNLILALVASRNGLTKTDILETVGGYRERFAAAGATRLYLQVLDLTDLDHLRLVARDVMPHV